MRESRFAGVPLSNRGILKDAPRFIQRAFCNRMDQRCSACWSVKVLRKYGEAEGAPDFYHAWKYRHPNKRLPGTGPVGPTKLLGDVAPGSSRIRWWLHVFGMLALNLGPDLSPKFAPILPQSPIASAMSSGITAVSLSFSAGDGTAVFEVSFCKTINSLSLHS